jgi:membrane protein YdbS with pleckstrin-like domain
MNQVRAIVMLIAAGIAFYRGWMLHGSRAVVAFALAALALAMAVWHLIGFAQGTSSRRGAVRAADRVVPSTGEDQGKS